MRNVLVCLLLCSLVCAALCSPVKITFKDVDQHVKTQQGHGRFKRFTCDVLSAEAKGIKLNHAACGVHCLFNGKRGGWCDNRRVCNCRN